MTPARSCWPTFWPAILAALSAIPFCVHRLEVRGLTDLNGTRRMNGVILVVLTRRGRPVDLAFLRVLVLRTWPFQIQLSQWRSIRIVIVITAANCEESIHGFVRAKDFQVRLHGLRIFVRAGLRARIELGLTGSLLGYSMARSASLRGAGTWTPFASSSSIDSLFGFTK